MSTPKPPKQLRITLKQQFDYDYRETGEISPSGMAIYENVATEVVPLGYSIAYTPNTKAYEKQRISQDNWAYGDSHHDNHFIVDDKYWHRSSRWMPKPEYTAEEARAIPKGEGYHIVATDTIFEDRFQPIIIDNEPLEGFRIQHMVARYKGNKLWRILDPRGFELEIASGTFEDIVMSGIVDKGLIVGPCVWQSSKKLVRV